MLPPTGPTFGVVIDLSYFPLLICTACCIFVFVCMTRCYAIKIISYHIMIIAGGDGAVDDYGI